MRHQPNRCSLLSMGLLLLSLCGCGTKAQPATGGDDGCTPMCGGGQQCVERTCVCAVDEELCDGACVAAGSCSASSSAGTGGTGGTAETGGTAGTGGSTSGTTGVAGAGAQGGSGGTGTMGGCSFSDVSVEVSRSIFTVGIVTFATDLADLTGAEVHFSQTSGAGVTQVATVDLDEAGYRTLLLGMKAATDYDMQIIASAGESTCESEVYSLSTGPLPAAVPRVSREVSRAAEVTPGFIVTSNGISNLGMMDVPVGNYAFIFDHEGDVVWYAPAPGQPSRVRMSYDGKYMYMMALNVQGGMGQIDRVSMDGLETETNLSGVEEAHHDFTVLPNGSIVAIVHQDDCSGIVERTQTGQVISIVENVNTLYQPSGDCHTNAIQYYPGDDTFTISDRNPNLFVKITRQGQLLWQFGGSNPLGDYFPGTWTVNHGHELLKNGNFLFFNNGNTGQSPVYEYTLDESTWTASEVWSYSSEASSPTLGDVQRLPNGNTLVTYSNDGTIHEVNPDSELVQTFTATGGAFGYANHRPSLYGPPPR